MKKSVKIFSFFISIILSVSVFAYPTFALTPPARYDLPFDLNVASYILVSLDTGEVIFEKDSEVQRVHASLTKLMTAYLDIKYVDDLD